MNCPECKSKAKVDESRTRDNNTWRRRTCLSCGYKYQTVEKLFVKPVLKPVPKPEPIREIPKKKQIKKPTLPKKVQPDFDKMTDEELEAWIFSEGASFDED